MVDETARAETEDPELTAGRIEAALERIAHRIDAAARPRPAEVSARLDILIERLRAVLAQPAE